MDWGAAGGELWRNRTNALRDHGICGRGAGKGRF